MGTHPAERAIELWERYMFLSLASAIVLLVAQHLTGWQALDWARAAAWTAAGGCSIQVARALRRAGRDGSAAVFRAVMCFAFAVLALI